MFSYFSLILVLQVVGVLVYDIDRPEIKCTNGHLIFKAPNGKDIIFETSQKSSIKLNNLNLQEIAQASANVSKTLLKYRAEFDRALDIITSFEQVRPNVGINTSTAYPINQFSAIRSVRRLNRRVTNMQLTIALIKQNLETNFCSPNPCTNGGTCQQFYNRFHCLCPPNWQGSTCAEDVNECATLAGTELGCQNGATCVNQPGAYACLCMAGWFGVHCTKRTNDCSSASGTALCGHGICVPANGDVGYKCICDQGWRTDGKTVLCGTDVNECTDGVPHCSVNPPVTCVNLPGSFKCGDCPMGYTGNGFYCRDVDECLTDNGGCSTNPMVQCVNTLGSSYCGHCPPGYAGNGRYCSYQGTCNVNNGGCHPLATCTLNTIISSSFVQCTCPIGYRGSGFGPTGCTATGISACNPNPCIHGVCNLRNNTAVCSCFKGYSGPTCANTINPCASNPCQNGGTCYVLSENGVRCICPAMFSGYNCEREKSACGGRLTALNGTLRFPSLGGSSYGDRISCSWTISTNESMVLNVTFFKFKLEQSSNCQYDWLQIHDGRNTLAPSLGRFCTGLPNGGSLMSTHNILYLWFRSDHTISDGGFALNWTSVQPSCGSAIDVVTHGVIKSPGAPGNYPNQRDCYWTLSVPEGKRLLFHFFTLMIGDSKDCSHDTLTFYSEIVTEENSFAKFCKTTHPAPLYSPGSKVVIHFHSDVENNYPGFQISYAVDSGIPGCGGVYTLDQGEIRSPKYNGKYPPNLLCEYKIKVSDKSRIRLKFLSFDLEESPRCRFDSLTIYEGSTPDAGLIAKLCGSNLPPIYTTSLNEVLVVFKTDWATMKDGFVLSYEMICGNTFTSLSGVIKSPGYPRRVSMKNCIYEIVQPLGTGIILNITNLDLETNSEPECIYDYLEVRDGDSENSTLIGRYCSKAPPLIISKYNYLWLKFKTDESETGLGFSATYTTKQIGCGGILKSKSGTISSHNSSSTSSYQSLSYCQWIILAPPGYVIQISFMLFNIEKSYLCNFDYVEVFDNNTNSNLGGSMGKFCGQQQPPLLMTSSNIATIRFVTDATVNNDGFIAAYHTIKEENVCGGNFFTKAGTIKSPGYPANYRENQECSWLLAVEPGHQIMLNITDFHLESYPNCKYDYIEIRNGGTKTSPLIGRYCGTKIPKLIPSHTNRIFITFKSDSTKNDRGFKIVWDSTSTQCGGTLNAPTGSIITPNYPEPYDQLAVCVWKILVSAGSAIQAVFSDFDLESHEKCQLDYVELYDGPSVQSKLLGRFCHSHPSFINSTSNTMTVKFRSDVSQQGRGFQLQYNTLCNVTLTGFGGVIESPNFPNNYPYNLNCNWNIEVDKRNKINLTFSHFDLEFLVTAVNETKRCAYDYIRIEYQPFVGSYEDRLPYKSVGTYCGPTPPDPIHIESDTARVRFVTDSLLHGNGFRLEWVLDGCGGVLTHPNGTIHTPNYPQAYETDSLCKWLIKVDYGQNIELTFHQLHLEENHKCEYDYAHVFNGEDETYPEIAKICHQKSPTVIASSGNSMYIIFKSDLSGNGRGFTANYTTLPTKCGGKYTAKSGTIISPNYPNSHDKEDTCDYLIEVTEGRLLKLNFEDLDLVKDHKANCSSANVSTVRVYDGPSQAYPLIANLCGRGAPNTTYYSSSNHLFIELVTMGEQVGKGFKAKYTHACGARIITGSHGTIESDGTDVYNDAYEMIICNWTIIATNPTKHVSLIVSYFDDSSNYEGDSLSVYNGESSDAPLIDNYVKLPSTITSTGNALYIELKASVRMFATYSVYDNACGGTFKNNEGTIASPGYPKRYPVNVQCEWIIEAPEGNALQLNFGTFALESSEHCNSDYLEIRNGNSSGKLLGVYCGNDVPSNITTTGSLWLYLKTDEAVEDGNRATGFITNFELLSSTELSGPYGIIQCPVTTLYQVYSWTITVDVGKQILLTFLNFEVSSLYGSECWQSLQIYDGINAEHPKLGEYCGWLSPSPVRSTSNTVFITITTNYGYESTFKIEWQQINPVYTKTDVTNSSCARNEYDLSKNHSVMIKSPGYPNGYDNNLKCEWIITTTPINHLRVSFMVLSFEEWLIDQCYGDYVAIYEKNAVIGGDWKLTKKVCHDNETNIQFLTTNMMKLVFNSNAFQNGSGFMAHVSEVCGGTLTEPKGLVYFGKDSIRPFINFTGCEWLVKVRPGRSIRVRFLELDIIQTNDKCEDYVILRNGQYKDSPVLGEGKYCGTSLPNKPLETTGNYLFIKHQLKKIGPAFKIAYEEVSNNCVHDISLDDFTNSTTISSTNYPKIPISHSECVWRVMTIPGESIRIDFDKHFDFASSPGCEKEYVEVRDGGTVNSKLLGRFCTETPSTLYSSDNILFVKHFTEVDDPGNGFQATVSIAKCGGTYYGSNIKLNPSIFLKTLTNANCTWFVRAPKNHNFQINFTLMDLIPSVNCSGTDYLTVSEPLPTPDYSETLLGTYCGSSTPDSLTSSGSEVIVRLKTGGKAQHKRFAISFNASHATCGGTYEASEGFISSPNPSFQYARFCKYLIRVPKGRRVKLEFTDYDIYNSKSIFEGLQFFNAEYNSFITSTTLMNNFPRIVKSSSNILMVYYWMRAANGRGFQAKFSSNERTICIGDFNNTDSGILLPPQEKTNSFACTYERHSPKGGTLALSIVSSANSSKGCSEYYGSFKLYSNNKLIDSMCTPNEKLIRTPYIDHQLKISSNYRYLLNFTVTYKQYACGGFKTNTGAGVIEIGSENNLECSWLIQEPPNSMISISFDRFDLGANCESSYLRIYNGDLPTSPQIGDFCKSSKPDNFQSESNALWIDYRAGPNAKSNGFKLTHTRSDNSACGGVFHDRTRILQTPNYPNDYPKNAECSWELQTQGGYHIGLIFTGRFELEKTTNCTNDFIEITDWTGSQWKSLGRFCGREIANFNSTSNKMRILFRSNGLLNGAGFQARWEWNCGGSYIADYTKKYIVSPNFPLLYPNKTSCEYNITARGKHIQLEFIEFDVEGTMPNCRYDNLSISAYYNLKQFRRSIFNRYYCGTEKPQSVRLNSNVYLHFKSDPYLQRRGFKISYVIDDCDASLTSPGVIESPALNQTMSKLFTASVSCTWNITAPKGKNIVVRFDYFRFTHRVHCYYDSVQVYEGLPENQNRLVTLCGDLNENLPVITSKTNRVTIKLMTDASINRRGFKASIYFTASPEAGCGGVINVTSKAQEVKSPILNDGGACTWHLVAPPDTVINITLKSVDLSGNCNDGKELNNACECNMLELRDGMLGTSELIEKYCNLSSTSLEREFVTSGEQGLLRLWSLSFRKRVFVASVVAQESICGKSMLTVKATTQVLISPGYPNSYPENLRCSWRISSTSKFQLYFTDFELNQQEGGSSRCVGDRLSIIDNFNFGRRHFIEANGFGPLYQISGNRQNTSQFLTYDGNFGAHQFCGSSNKPFDYYLNEGSISIKFLAGQTSSTPRKKGFKLEYRKIECNRNITTLHGRIMLGDDNECYILITVPKHYTISIFFQSFYLAPDLKFKCTLNYLDVHEGATVNSPLLKKLCGYATPSPIFSKTNQLLIHAKNTNHAIRLTTDFVYTSSNQGVGCGGDFFNYKGRFTSPLYPSPYRNSTPCEWTIAVPDGMRVALKFEVFEIDNDDCKNNYLSIEQIGQEEPVGATKYCKSQTHPVFYASTKEIRVIYQSSLLNKGRGFLALFEAVY